MFAVAKRIILFMLVNILVITTLSVVLNLLGVRPYLSAQGIDYEALLAFCLVWGMGGAFISLALSRVMAKWMMGVRIIDVQTREPALQQVVEMVHRSAQAAGLRVMPEVGYYDSPEVNAFATGPTRNRSLVAVSTGLLRSMRREEVEGVIAHEVAHVANGDMVTMTLVQGVVNAFVMFLARVLAFAIAQAASRSRDEGEGFSHGIYMITTFVLEMVFMFLGMIVVAWFSRWREFRADAGGARLGGRDKMIAALSALKRNIERADDPHLQGEAAFQSMKISTRGSFMRLFSTHPPLEERIARLEAMI